VVQAFLESQYKLHTSSIFQTSNLEHDAVKVYRMKNKEDFNAHVAIIPFRYVQKSHSIQGLLSFLVV
jgi:DNA topoisomerase IA